MFNYQSLACKVGKRGGLEKCCQDGKILHICLESQVVSWQAVGNGIKVRKLFQSFTCWVESEIIAFLTVNTVQN